MGATGIASTTVPQLRFGVEAADALEYAVVPTLRFSLRIDAAVSIRSILLDVQIQIAARQRLYGESEGERLIELFGTPDRWRTTLRTLPWTRTTVVVPPFTGTTVIGLDLPCSYDLEVTASRYFAALGDGEVPLELLFSGSVFFADADGALQTIRIALDTEVEYRLPVSVWREAIDRHFPGSAWLRLSRECHERLWSYKARHGFASWDDAIAALLEEGCPE